MTRKLLFTLLALFISNAAFADQNSLLVQKYLNAFASRDSAGLFQLFNWEGMDKNSRISLQKHIKSGFRGRQIRRIYIEPVPADLNPNYSENGKDFQLNLKPSGQMTVVFISNKGHRSTTKLFVGQHKGKLMIGSAVEAPKQLACNADGTTKAAC